MRIIDMRSDTVTHPTPEMREAMYRAEVGDDVFGDDPTVNRLEALAAEHTGKEAALFVASGTMGNLVSLLAHCGRGDEAIVGDKSHTLLFEQGGMAALGGITPRTIPNQPDGTLRLEDIDKAVRADDPHFPRSRLVCLENTHNVCNGVPLTAAYTAQVAQVARAHGLRVHVDGARIFNAAAALGVTVAELVREVDSVTFCLSKGLCCPVGSMVCGSTAFIAEARRARKLVGGGMRQAGILAAAGIVALEQIAPRLGEDHARARRLAEGLAEIPGIEPAPVHSNILYFALAEGVSKTNDEIVDALAAQGVWLLGRENGRFRAVLHYWISDADVEFTLQAMRDVMLS
ncbi:MAG: low-specificity L-threonine aldolase [Anaerolineae bacterium]|nr:low-specificity L-threonine aldolase [Anaerolineae bacterium]